MNIRQRASRYAVACTGLALVALSAARATEAPFNGMLEVLVGDYWVMHLEARDGRWQPVRRSKPSFTWVDHGYVVRSEGDADHLKLEIHLRKDSRRADSFVFYEFDLRRRQGDRYAGTFTSTSGGERSSGTLSGFRWPARPVTGTQPSPARPGEHPRLLFREADLAKMRTKLKTPFGQAFLAVAKQSRDPVVQGLLYQLTGDKQHAWRVKEWITRCGDIDANGRLTGEIGHQIVRVVTAYDLCHDAWSEEYRNDLRQQIKARLPKRQRNLTLQHANYSPTSNYYGPGFGSAAIATLALFGDKGPAPARPVAPLCVAREGCVIPPAKDYQPPHGVPVRPLVDDKMPKEWIYVGGFKPARGEELLERLGGLSEARPTLDDVITDGKRTERFRAVSHEPDRGYYVWRERPVIDVTNAIGRVYHSVSYFYTVFRNDRPRWVEFKIGPDHKESITHINGVRIEEDHVAYLEKGLYPVLIKVRIGQTEPWGREMLAPRFKSVSRKEARERNAEIRGRYEDAMRFWKTEMAEWKARDGEDLDILRMVCKGHKQMYWHYRMGIGDGGFQAEVTHYGNIAAYYPTLYASYYRSVFGRDASPYPDVSHLLPRRMMQGVFGGGKPEMMNLNVKANYDLGWVANLFPLVPDRYKPSVLWGWNNVAGADTDAASPDLRSARKIMSKAHGLTLATTYVNYPLDLKPVHPSDGMPRTWAADTLGFYAFRNGWQGSDEVVAQVFLKSIPIRAWNHPNAGAFRLQGLGHRWTSAPIERSGYRPEESIVLLPDNVTNESACARMVHYDVRPNGSGSLTMDMNDVYLTPKDPERKKKELSDQIMADMDSLMGDTMDDDLGIGREINDMPINQEVIDFYREKENRAKRKKIPKLYDWYGRRRQNVKRNDDLTGSRSLAFDFSGASGAPCLMVMVDRVKGGGKKQWLWHLPKEGNFSVRVVENTFTVSYPDATLKATFISPAKLDLRHFPNKQMSFIYRGGSRKGQMETRHYNFLCATSTEYNVDFLVIVTLQRGRAPAVRSSLSSLDGVVRVGNQKVRYRDNKIVFENWD